MLKTPQKGFTLIEVLVVVSIIGLLASIVLVGLGGFRSQGRDAKRIADLKQTQNALELYYTKCQHYPGDAACGLGDPGDWAGLGSAVAGAGIGVSKIANDPLPGNPQYDYGVSGNRQNYVLSGTLEDENNSSLKEDSDGTVFGVLCDDPVYCVEF